MPIPPARHQYDDVEDEIARQITRIGPFEPTMTQQHFAADADLNTIVKRYGITDGAIPPAALDPRFFGDFTNSIDFRDAMDRIASATFAFNSLPADLRARFGNDPIALHDFVMDPANVDESVRLGLLAKRESEPLTTPERVKRDSATGREQPVQDSSTGVT